MPVIMISQFQPVPPPKQEISRTQTNSPFVDFSIDRSEKKKYKFFSKCFLGNRKRDIFAFFLLLLIAALIFLQHSDQINLQSLVKKFIKSTEQT